MEDSQKGIWQAPINGGEEFALPELSDAGGWRSWDVTALGIFYMARLEKPPFRLKFYNFETGQTEEIWTTEKQPLNYHSGLSAAPDGNWLLYSQYDQNASSILLTDLPEKVNKSY